MIFRRFRNIYRVSRNYINKFPPLKWTLSALYWFPLAITIEQYFFTLKVVTGRSMQPSLNPDTSQWRDLVIFNRFATKTMHEYNREDVVALRSPTNPGTLLVKRIIALPGDIVQTLPPYPDTEVKVPPGHVWVEGDHPFHSEDSNWFGPVPQALIDAKLSWIVFPFYRWGPLGSVFKRPQLGQAWSREEDELRRWKKREARVTFAT